MTQISRKGFLQSLGAMGLASLLGGCSESQSKVLSSHFEDTSKGRTIVFNRISGGSRKTCYEMIVYFEDKQTIYVVQDHLSCDDRLKCPETDVIGDSPRDSVTVIELPQPIINHWPSLENLFDEDSYIHGASRIRTYSRGNRLDPLPKPVQKLEEYQVLKDGNDLMPDCADPSLQRGLEDKARSVLAEATQLYRTYKPRFIKNVV